MEMELDTARQNARRSLQQIAHGLKRIAHMLDGNARGGKLGCRGENEFMNRASRAQRIFDTACCGAPYGCTRSSGLMRRAHAHLGEVILDMRAIAAGLTRFQART